MGPENQQLKAEVIVHARQDLAQRLGVDEQSISEGLVEPFDFPNAALGAPVEDEMSAQVITPGWRLTLKANGKSYQYRANDRQLRLFNFDGENYRV